MVEDGVLPPWRARDDEGASGCGEHRRQYVPEDLLVVVEEGGLVDDDEAGGEVSQLVLRIEEDFLQGYMDLE